MAGPSTDQGSRPAELALLTIVGLLLIALVVTSAAEVDRTSSGTWDETIYLALGRQALARDATAFADLGVAPLPVRLVWNRATLEPLDRDDGDPAYYRARLSRARQRAVWTFGVPLVLVLLYWVGLRHGPTAGILAAALVALSPNVHAHVSLATTDVPLVLTFVATMIAVIVDLERPSWGSAALLAVVLGAALATKYSALSLFLAVTVLFVWHRHRPWWSSMLIGLGALTVTWGCHWWALSPVRAADSPLHGLPVPIFWRGIRFQMYLDGLGQMAFLLGDRSRFGWPWYFPFALLVKSSPVELVALASFITTAAMRRGGGVEARVLAVCFVVFGGAALLGHRDIGVRYVLPLVVTALMSGAIWLRTSVRTARVAVAVAAVAVIAQAISFFSIAPQHLAYFNDLAGGPSAGYTRLVDSNVDWGQDLVRLREWMRARGIERVSLVYFGSAPLAAYDITAGDWREYVSHDLPNGPKAFVISVTALQGLTTCGDAFAPLRTLEPSWRIGYSLMAYSLDRRDVVETLDRIARDPCSPRE